MDILEIMIPSNKVFFAWKSHKKLPNSLFMIHANITKNIYFITRTNTFFLPILENSPVHVIDCCKWATAFLKNRRVKQM